MKAIDLFCGCGGLSAGIKDAGFEIAAGVDVEPHYIQTFAHNFPEAQAIKSDITELSSSELMRIAGVKPGQLDILVGGPPCQGFSKNVPRSKRKLNSENNMLVRAFLSHCEEILPRWVVMENVAEMRNGFNQAYTLEVIERLTKAGYKVIHDVFNAANFGVPQRRRRAFFIGSRDGSNPNPPAPTHSKEGTQDLITQRDPHITVWDAIGDLRPLRNGEGAEPCGYASGPVTQYQKTARANSTSVYNHVARELRPKQYQRIASLDPGQGIKDLPEEIRPKGGYSGAYGRLTEEMVMPTITRWVFHPGSGRWGHPRDKRLITIREAARLHGFKDQFVFVGSYVQQAGQLGNAVPPILATAVVRALLNGSCTA